MSTNSYLQFTALSLALSQVIFSVSLPATAALQQTQQQPLVHSHRMELAGFFGFKFRGIRASRNLYGGGVRGECMGKQVEMKALTPQETNKPEKNEKSDSQLGLTVAQNPTFYVFIPNTTAKQAKFTFMDGNDNNVIYEKTFLLTSLGGVASFTLPTDAGGLKANQEYHWALQLICGSSEQDGDQGGNLIVGGAIQRVEPNASLASRLRNASLSDRLNLYAENSYWYDTVKTLADLRAVNPNDPTLANDWKKLLSDGGLQEIAQYPLIQCCTLR